MSDSKNDQSIGVASYMPGVKGFTMASFKASDVPEGSHLFLAPPKVRTQANLHKALIVVRDALLEAFDADRCGISHMPMISESVCLAAYVDEILATTTSMELDPVTGNPRTAPQPEGGMLQGPARQELYVAAIECEHSISEDCIVLHRHPKLPGNALSQLADRLVVAAKNQPAIDDDQA